MQLRQLVRCACVQLLTAVSITGVKLSPSETQLQDAEKVATYRTGVSTASNSTGHRDAGRHMAVLISGQLFRYVHRDSFQLNDQMHSLKQWMCDGCQLDFHIVLSGGTSTGHGTDCDMTIPYVNTKDAITEYYKSRGADNVNVVIVTDAQMQKDIFTLNDRVGSIASNELRIPVHSFWDKVEKIPQIGKQTNPKAIYEGDNNMFWLRHRAYRLALNFEKSGQFQYSNFLYLRDDNSFVHSDEYYSMADLVKNMSGSDVYVDEYCGWGSYSDKMYLTGRAGADRLFAPDLEAHASRMANWLMFAVHYRDRPWRCKKYSAVQTECWLQELLNNDTQLNVSKFDFHRTDLRYNGGNPCTVQLYERCSADDVQRSVATCPCGLIKTGNETLVTQSLVNQTLQEQFQAAVGSVGKRSTSSHSAAQESMFTRAGL